MSGGFGVPGLPDKLCRLSAIFRFGLHVLSNPVAGGSTIGLSLTEPLTHCR